MAATIKIPTTFTAVDKFSKIVSKMSRGVKKFSRTGISAIKRFDHRVTKTFKKMGRLARLGVGVGASFIALNAVEIVKNYEQSLADLSAVMNTTRQNEILLSNDAERLGATTAKSATEVVGLQEAFARLGFPTDDIINMTEATINGSIAMNSELSDTAELTGAMIRTFDNFSSIDAPAILDKMTLSTQKSALNFIKLQSALPNVAGAANAAGVDFDTLLGLLGKLSDAGIDASASGTALKNIFIQAKAKGADYNEILSMISKSSDKLTASNDKFGKIAAVSGTILASKLKEVGELTKTLGNDFKGVADEAAKKRLNTFGGSITLLKSAYEGLLLKTNESSGAMSIMKNVVDFVTRNIETLALGLATVVGLFVLMKVIVIGTTVVTGAYNIALGINTALTQTNKKALIGNTIATNAYKVAMAIGTGVTWLATAATTAFGIALNLGLWPILLIIAAIVAVVLVIKNWSSITAWFGDKWGQFTKFIGEAWGKVVSWFTEFDFKGMFMDIGQSILKFMLFPLKTMLELLARIPGKIGNLAQMGLDKIGGITGEMKVSADGEPLSSTTQASNKEVSESIQKSRLAIDIRDKGGNVESVSRTDNNDDIPVNITNTVGAF